MTTWHAQTTAPAPPEDVLDVLPTRPLARWSPVAFDIEEIDSERLQAGTHARVAGSLAGREIRFDVAVMEAEPERLLLQACGPVGLDVEYTIAPAPQGSAIDAAITVRGRRGITKTVFARAAAGSARRRRPGGSAAPTGARGRAPRAAAEAAAVLRGDAAPSGSPWGARRTLSPSEIRALPGQHRAPPERSAATGSEWQSPIAR